MPDNDKSHDDIAELLRNDNSLDQPTDDFVCSLRDRTTNEMRRLFQQRPQCVMTKKRFSLSLRFAVAIMILIATTGIAAQFALHVVGGQVAFADVQKAVQSHNSVTYKETTTRRGKPAEEVRWFIAGPNQIRAERSDGSYSIIDTRARKTMQVIADKKTAAITLGVAVIPENFNLYNRIRDIAEDATERLPNREIDGKRANGFLIHPSEDGAPPAMKVWVDPETKLPVRFEMDHEGIEIISSEFAFDREFAPSLFSFSAPEGYELTTTKVPALAPVDNRDANLILTPLVGIGEAKFGMSKEEVIVALGRPDEVLKAGKAQVLQYYSRGFVVQLYDTHGLVSVQVYLKKNYSVQARDFPGKTDKGIGLGASEAEIKRAYGNPERVKESTLKEVYGKDTRNLNKKTGQKTLYYDSLKLWFTLSHGKLSGITSH